MNSKRSRKEPRSKADANCSSRPGRSDNTVVLHARRNLKDPAGQSRSDGFAWITENVARFAKRRRGSGGWIAFIIFAPLRCSCRLLSYKWQTGGCVGGRKPAVWLGVDITNFVVWIGIGHAGTLISAISFLNRQNGGRQLRAAGSDDAVRGDVRGLFTRAFTSARFWKAWYLFPTRTGTASGKLSFAAAVGCVRGITYFTVRGCSGTSA